MGIFNIFKKKTAEKKEEAEQGAVAKSEAAKERAKKAEREIKQPKPAYKPIRDSLKARRFNNVNDILIKPLITEKISNLGVYNQYAFKVALKANKIQIKKAIETYYHVKPLKVNIINMSGRNVRWGRTRGRTRAWKKAIVTLRQGDKIEVYEGV